MYHMYLEVRMIDSKRPMERVVWRILSLVISSILKWVLSALSLYLSEGEGADKRE